jgi:Na+-translocating ferredoxin:NAD+ oxidoreductase subunit D
MSTPTTVIEIRTSPHLHSGRSVDIIMRNVVYALLPICAYSFWLFGVSAVALLVASVAGCLATEHLVCRISGRESSINDFSAVITGVLLGLVLPPGLPLWMAVVGGFIAIAPGKMVFGGLGFNVFNPALVGRAFLQAAFPTAIMAYTQPLTPSRFSEFIPSTLALPFMKSAPLANISSATPLNLQKFDHVPTALGVLFSGERAGSLGETCAPLIFICGLYLIARRFMDWRIPVSMLLGAIVSGGLFHLADSSKYPDPAVHVLSGGLMLGAMFMATDPVASPVTPRGMWIYGIVMGVLTVLIRLLGGLAEGVMYAILLGNAIAPAIDNLTQPRTYGERKRVKQQAVAQ